VFREHFTSCFIDDAFGLKNLDAIGEDNVCYECDYPHSDTLWPLVPERLWETVRHLATAQIKKVTHQNAMRIFSFDPFKHHRPDELTAGALRELAGRQGVDVSVKSSGGAAPLAPGEKRPVTSGISWRCSRGRRRWRDPTVTGTQGAGAKHYQYYEE